MTFLERTKISLVGLCLLALAACSSSNVSRSYGLWSSDVVQDQCNISEFVLDFFAEGRLSATQSSAGSWHNLRTMLTPVGSDEWWKIKFSTVQKRILDDIREQFFTNSNQDCFTEIGIEATIDGRRSGQVETFYFTSPSNSEICISNRFSINVSDLRSGEARSCTQKDDRKVYFRVIYNPKAKIEGKDGLVE